MRELKNHELSEVTGGIGIAGAAIGAAIGAGGAIVNDASAGQVIGAAVVGGVSGFFGGIATSGLGGGLSRGMFSIFAVETGILSGAIGS